jgi:hypothetical protein
VTALLEQLLDLALRDPQAYAALRDSRIDEITPQLASETRQRFKDASREQRPGDAAAAAFVASGLYLVLGQRHESLQNYYDFQQIRYMAANTEEQYRGVREDLLGIVPMAEEIGSLDLAFKAATLAADCSYWASQLPDVSAFKERWLRQTLGDLVVAASYGPNAPSGGESERFVSLLAAFTEAFTTAVPAPDGAAEQQLRELARSIEGFVPIEFEYIGGPEKTVVDGRLLALLAYRYGNQSVAKKRLEFVNERR